MRSTFKFNVVGWVNASAIFTLSDIDLFVAVGSLDVNIRTAVITLSDIVSLTVGDFDVNIRTAVCVVVATWSTRVSDAWRGLVMSGGMLTVPWRILLRYDRDGGGVLWDGDLPLRKQ